MNSIIKNLSELEGPKVTLLAILFVIILSVVDYATGPQVTLSFFYVIPIVGVTWLVGRGSGTIIALVSTLSWLAADLLWASEYPNLTFLFWNGLIRFAVFSVMVMILSELKDTRKTLEQKVDERTESLTAEINHRIGLEEELRKQKNRLEETLLELTQLQQKLIESERTTAVSEIARALAHHINNPLTIISISLQSKLRHKLPEDIRQEYTQWLEQLNRIRDVVREVTSLPDTNTVDIGGGYRMMDIKPSENKKKT